VVLIVMASVMKARLHSFSLASVAILVRATIRNAIVVTSFSAASTTSSLTSHATADGQTGKSRKQALNQAWVTL
jgi:hypothetical protein